MSNPRTLFLQLLENRNRWLLVAFGSYLLLMATFALVYQQIYRHDAHAFLFAKDMQTSQETRFASDAKRTLVELSRRAEALTQAITQLKDVARSVEDGRRLALPDGNTLVLGKDAVVNFTGGGTYWRTLSVETPKGETVLRWNPDGVKSWPTGRAEIAATLTDDRERVTGESRAIEARMKTLGTDEPDVWSLLDFLYFSVMTQATVGYGDIIPNSTEVRVVVVLQVLCGYLVLVVLINWAVVTRRVLHAAAGPQSNECIQPPAQEPRG